MTDIWEQTTGWLRAEVERLQADLNQAENNGIEFEMQRDKALAERDLWKERTEQGSLIIEGNVTEIERLRTTVNDQAATITGLLREIDRLLATPPIARHDTDTRP